MEANMEQLKYAMWLDKELDRSVKHLAKTVSINGTGRQQAEYRVRATQDAIRQVNGQQLFQYRAEKAKDVLYQEMLAGQIQPALYRVLTGILEAEQ